MVQYRVGVDLTRTNVSTLFSSLLPVKVASPLSQEQGNVCVFTRDGEFHRPGWDTVKLPVVPTYSGMRLTYTRAALFLSRVVESN